MQSVLSDLLPGTTYYYRVIAGNRTGTTRGAIRTFTTSTDQTEGADLTVSQTDTLFPVAGRPMTYTIIVRNNGPLDATGVTLVDTLPESISFGSVSPTPPTCQFAIYEPDENNIYCALGTLAARTSRIIMLVVTPNRAGTITNTVAVRAEQFDPNRFNNTASIATPVAAAPVGESVEIQVTPERGGVLVLTDTRGYTVSVTIPRGAVLKPSTITLTDLPEGPTRPLNADWGFAGRALVLETFQDGVVQPGFIIERAATISLSFDTRLVSDTEQLRLMSYDPNDAPHRAYLEG
ncbi:MAG: DUF11 domain-containing protein [Chloroflexaceae bacterium]|nr:DUF11 domain-containing protein [Chloroflexaceae bacterium]